MRALLMTIEINRSLSGQDFLPFIAGIEQGVPSILISHNIVTCMDSDYPASLSKEVHRVLREESHFDGVIMTDDLSMGAIKQFASGSSPPLWPCSREMICC